MSWPSYLHSFLLTVVQILLPLQVCILHGFPSTSTHPMYWKAFSIVKEGNFYFLIPAKGQVAAPCMFHDTIYLFIHFLQVSFLHVQKIQPAHPKGDQSWVFVGRTDVEADTPILWPPDAKSWLIWKDPDAGKDWGQMEKGTTGDEMVGWHHRLNEHEFGWTLGFGDGQGGLVCHDWTELILILS